MTLIKSNLHLILGLALAALVGFLLGKQTNSKDVPAEDSKIISEEAPAPAAQVPPPETATTVAPGSPPSPQGEHNKTPVSSPPANPNQFAESLAKLKYVEFRKICDQADSEWRKSNLDSRAATPTDAVGQELSRKQLLDSLKGHLTRVSYFRGDGTITLGSRQIQFDVFLNFYNQKDQTQDGRLPKIIDPADLCYNIGPVILVDGVPSQQSMSSMSTCGAALPKIGENFYISWTTVADKPVQESISMVLFPLPGSKNGALNYMVSNSEKWETMEGFRWQNSNKAEFDQALARYQKIREGQTN